MSRLLTVLLTVVLLAGTASAYVVAIEGDVLPTDASIGWNKLFGSSDMTLVTEEGRTCLYQAANKPGYSMYGFDSNGPLDPAEDLIIEICMKIGTNGGTTSYEGYLEFSNGTYGYGLDVRKPDDGIVGTHGQPGNAAIRQIDNASQPYWDFDDPAEGSELDGGFHIYRWEVLASDPTDYNFTVDGIPGTTLDDYSGGNTNWEAKPMNDDRILVGDLGDDAGMEIWFDYIRITPEPVTLAILMIGGLAALARRRK